jgi:hypothetical protein
MAKRSIAITAKIYTFALNLTSEPACSKSSTKFCSRLAIIPFSVIMESISFLSLDNKKYLIESPKTCSFIL